VSEIVKAPPDVTVPLDEAAARRLAGRIRRMGQTFIRNWETLAGLVEEAKAGSLHEALGFPSWPAYLADALGGQISVGGEARRELVQYLAGEGMSQRAIAQVAGVGKTTVQRELSGGPSGPGDSWDVYPEGGSLRDVVRSVSRWPSTTPAQPEAGSSVDHDPPASAKLRQRREWAAQEQEKLAPQSSETVNGLDGKTYRQPARKPPTRKPITKAFFEAVFEMGKVTNRIERLAADDRFGKNRNELARHAADLLRYQQRITDVIAQLRVDQTERDGLP